MDWKCDKDDNMDYYYTQLPKEGDKEKALVEWWLKIFELANDISGWDIVIADQWIDNTGRIIGHIQKKNDAIGKDMGFRVAIIFGEFVERLNSAESEDDYNAEHHWILDDCYFLLNSSYKNEKVKEKAMKIAKKTPFKAYRAEYGRCEFEYFELKFED